MFKPCCGALGAAACLILTGPAAAHVVLEAGAPALRILAADTDAPAAIKAGTLELETPWLRATPGGAKVAGGYVHITNTGTAPDRLLSASIPLAGHGDVHEMINDNGVMRMRPIAGGLEIKPGQSVELKPGGYHLMFEDMTGALKQGEIVKGTLTFEKAGAVPVTFAVGGIGATSAPSGGGMHMQ